jgi:hypothetical protein
MKKDLRRALLDISQEGTGCSLQHAGSPCNSCFHAWAEDKLKLDKRLAHALWLINLSLRGDYTKASLEDAIKEL